MNAPELKLKYKNEIVEVLKKELELQNVMQLPRLSKIVINTSIAEAVQNKKVLDSVSEELAVITGQKPVITKAKKSIANFKLREGQALGCMVTLRKRNMWEFLYRLINIALPRVRDFRGVSGKAFDGHGNYTLGLKEQILFPEINYDRVSKIWGMNISIVTTVDDDAAAKLLLKHLGMPFKN